ncbi:Phosphate regulon transcriptional regulatory protein PhoB (SphR) [Pseudomonas chlororaphis subsp. aurantiaca]|uniref:response regulator n=1 Tax=Pseudomonas chlororaphis TaxID=587753 RepID=UPI00050D560B|nr:response regulator [Pseudomonas chlororaphis]AIS10240.1 chemotaxis protein CheY [Pseudomonas chlororaphis subsp. aurantiaca]AZD38992.1 Phosphate regulon transcriptional regulatory protein PhoB (SphR) [Pseudomonas chlororaphis subsp. aurantiaca]AZD45333.1 Phosphate regulon transcriptional regulatory protein PhoB (SphR) [Pseudomonas chlororaphis subsp. aurantiaca]QQX58842.1 response regulator [Pseudomonas chlororaphis subsp. aurantiaca]UVE45586.1 response regulator [Pseudomonas chlororaphis]
MSKVSVLVVDDASFIRDLVKKCLRNYFPGIKIEDAINGRKAQALLAREAFDLVLCDWEMPEMSGLELLTWCRGQESMKSMPFIMVTSRGDKENVVQAIQAGVSGYVSKPFTNEQLLTKVKQALNKVGKLDTLMNSAPTKMNSAFGNDSLSALTGGKAEVIGAAPAAAAVNPFAKPAVVSAPAPAAAPSRGLLNSPPVKAPAPAAAASAGGRGQGQLRLPSGTQQCVIKALSIKEALLVVKRTDTLPQVLDSAVLDLEQGDNAEVARLNGYLHAVVAYEPKPDSEWLQLTFRFVDQDAQKLDYISRLIARGTAQKHFVPGA